MSLKKRTSAGGAWGAMVSLVKKGWDVRGSRSMGAGAGTGWTVIQPGVKKLTWGQSRNLTSCAQRTVGSSRAPRVRRSIATSLGAWWGESTGIGSLAPDPRQSDTTGCFGCFHAAHTAAPYHKKIR